MSEYIVSKEVKKLGRLTLAEARKMKEEMGTRGRKYHIYKVELIS